MDIYENGLRNSLTNGEHLLMFAEDFTANALLQVRVYWADTRKIHEKPFLILVSAAPQAPAGKDGSRTYLLERPYGISIKFSVEELAAFSFALDRIASGAAEHFGIDKTWVKWTDPAKAKGGNTNGIGKKMLSMMPIRKRNTEDGRSVNIGFHCALAANTEDPRGMLKNCRRDDLGIKYSVTVNMGTYQAMATAMNLVSLAGDLTDLNRRHKFGRFRESSGHMDAVPTHPYPFVRRPASSGCASAPEARGVMRLHYKDNDLEHLV
jgi:hypothetical protein